MPMRLDDGWNQIQFNLSDFTRRAYGTNYIETLRVQVRSSQSCPACRERRGRLPVVGTALLGGSNPSRAPFGSSAVPFLAEDA